MTFLVYTAKRVQASDGSYRSLKPFSSLLLAREYLGTGAGKIILLPETLLGERASEYAQFTWTPAAKPLLKRAGIS